MANTTQQTTDRTIEILNDVLETCHDGEKGFRAAADAAQSAELKTFLNQSATQRATFASELTKVVTTLGGEPHTTGHVAGALHRGWLNIKTAISKHDDRAILEECEKGEDAAKEAFTKALKEPLPTDLRATIERMAAQVSQTHDRVKELRDKARATVK